MTRTCYSIFVPFLVGCASSSSTLQDAGPLIEDVTFVVDAVSVDAQDAPSVSDTYLPDVMPDAGSDAGSDATTDPLEPLDVPPDVPPSCEYSIEDGLSDLCFPACTSATGMAAASCGDSECLGRTFDSDESPAFEFANNPDEVWSPWLSWFVPNRCRQCERLSALSCWNRFCPAETAAMMSCFQSGETELCEETSSMLRACARANVSFSPCYRFTAARCLP